MIAFTCVHCGLRMTITETGGAKTAVCGTCDRTIIIPPSGPVAGPARRKTTKKAAPPAEKPKPGRKSKPAAKELHELPTRVETTPPHPLLPLILAPAQAAGELGRLGAYRVLEVIGQGGMGVVFKAHDPGLDRLVALKAMLPTSSDTARHRFLREARSAAAIQHDRVVTIFGVGEERGIPWLAMPLLRGESLEAYLNHNPGPLPEAEVRRIGAEIADGLGAIHELGLVHRDIKPGNVFLEGDSRRVKILDFGLARAATGDTKLTQEGAIVGSPAFMSPEQASRQTVDARADLFSLGCVLYLMATGELPFPAEDALSMLLALTTKEPLGVRTRNVFVSEGLAGVIERLLAKSPEARTQTAREVGRELAGS